MPFTNPGNLIDVGDGTLIVPPPANPPPPVPPAPPPPPLDPAPAPSIPIIPPGKVYIDTGDILGPPNLIPAPPAVQPGSGGSGGEGAGGEAVPPTDDLDEAGRIANANVVDLSDLPPFDLLDPFELQTFAVTNPPLKGGGALSAIAQAGADYGVDVLAIVADALHEGAGGGIGDGGTSYGPFQLHEGGALPARFSGKGRSNPVTNAWAWSENGIRYAVRSMAAGSPSARGLRGHAAVYAIVYGFERPADKPGAYRTRAAEYDKLVRLGGGWAQYAAPLFAGPQAGGATDTEPIAKPPASSYKPAGVTAQWRELVDVFKLGVPKASTRVESLAGSLKEVFR